MAMNGAQLGAEIKAAVEAAGYDLSDEALTIYTAIGTAIVLHLANNAVVNVPVEPSDGALQTSAAAGNPTTGPAVATALDGDLS